MLHKKSYISVPRDDTIPQKTFLRIASGDAMEWPPLNARIETPIHPLRT